MSATRDIPLLRSIGGGLLAALLFLACWLPGHPARPHLPTSDLYEHLSVARHLCQGDGFVTDMAYPLSFAYPFAREMPQPLIHRGPGYPLLLALPHLAAGGEPERVVDAVRILQILLLGAVAGLGAGAWLARGRAVNAVPFGVLLLLNPLLAFAVDWGFVELAGGLLLLALWLRTRDAQPAPDRARSGIGDGLLAGLLVLLRLDLFWVPLVWWLGLRRFGRRRLLAAVLTALVLLSPWEARNVRLTGRPFFSLQGQAELVKGTPAWPDYSVYRQLEPQPAAKALREMPGAIAHKAASGMKFHVLNAKRLLPGWYWLGLIGLAVIAAWRRRIGRGAPARQAPLATAALTTILLAAQYSFFDPNLRHLLVLLPVLAWELAPWTGEKAAEALLRGRLADGGRRTAAAVAIAVTLTIGGALLFPTRVPGWQQAETDAFAAAERVPELVAGAKQVDAPVYFTEYSAVSYLADRPAVWTPRDETVRRRIQDMISPLSGAPDGTDSDPMPEDLAP